MDVFCANCKEPWDSQHLLFDEVWDWDLPEFMARDFNRNPRFSGANDPVRDAAARAGWKFAGNSPLAILRCPACKGRAVDPQATRADRQDPHCRRVARRRRGRPDRRTQRPVALGINLNPARGGPPRRGGPSPRNPSQGEPHGSNLNRS